jgi:23S rRNA (adenine2503-C2)-methyltransferase
MHLSQFRDQLASLGANPGHQRRLLRRWVQGQPLALPGERLADWLPGRLSAQLPSLQQQLDALAITVSEHPAPDGSRLLVGLADGQSVEAVLLPRGGVCVSTQLGCAVGCRFCMTGQGGLLRQLGSAEIVAQVVLARRRQALRRVVFMGMGEPAHNLDAVLEAITLLGQEGGFGHKNLVFSTVGDPRVFERLPIAPVRPALALSLHSTVAARRRELLPRAPDIDPDELVAQADAYAQATHYPLQVQWTLLADVNDDDEEVEGLIRLFVGKRAIINFIPYNRVEGLPYARTDWDRAGVMARRLLEAGIVTRLRRSAAQDVDGGCGQLRARLVNPRARSATAGAAVS